MDIDSKKPVSIAPKSERPSWGPAGEIAKYTAVLALMIILGGAGAEKAATSYLATGYGWCGHDSDAPDCLGGLDHGG